MAAGRIELEHCGDFLFETYWILNEQTNEYEESLLNLKLIRSVEHQGDEKFLTTLYGERFNVHNKRPRLI